MLTRTSLAPARARTSLNPVLERLDVVTAEVAALRRAAPERAALVVVASWRDEHQRERVGCWLRSAPPEGGPVAVALGAHLECDVNGVLGASLRHALVVHDHDARPGCIDVLDLRTREGLRHDGDHGVRRVLAEGVARFGAGSSDVLALPLAPGERVHDGVERARDAVELPLAFPDTDERVGAVERSACGPVPMPSRAWRAGVTRVSVCASDEASGAVRVSVDELELHEGVLLGRDERCDGGDIDGRISRVHLWVRARGSRLLVADVGSTNGSAVLDAGRRVALARGRRAMTCARDATLLLAGIPVTLRVTG